MESGDGVDDSDAGTLKFQGSDNWRTTSSASASSKKISQFAMKQARSIFPQHDARKDGLKAKPLQSGFSLTEREKEWMG